MAGIMANSASATMVSGDTSADNAVAGYVVREAIALSVTPSGTTYQWSLSKPAGATSRSDLTDDDAATCSFVPDTAGEWLLSLLVDGATTYVLRVSVTAVAVSFTYEAMRFSPKLASAVPTPSTGSAISHDATSGLLSRKSTAGVTRSLEPRAFTPTDTNDATGVTGEWGFDSSYVYVKTAAGWKRAALSTF